MENTQHGTDTTKSGQPVMEHLAIIEKECLVHNRPLYAEVVIGICRKYRHNVLVSISEFFDALEPIRSLASRTGVNLGKATRNIYRHIMKSIVNNLHFDIPSMTNLIRFNVDIPADGYSLCLSLEALLHHNAATENIIISAIVSSGYVEFRDHCAAG